jgi:16S rRNA (cytosine967-C5)-methyltransferase
MVDPRHTALTVLNTLDQKDKTLDRVLLELPQGDDYLSMRDRALLSAIVYGVLRWRGRLDHIIAFFSNSPLHKIQPVVLNILRLGLFQIIFLDRVPDSAAVNTSVNLTRQTRNSRATGFVNALLRRAAVNAQKVPFATFQQDPLTFLTAAQSIPVWIAKRWLERFSAENIISLCKAINTIPPITLRANTLKINRQQLLGALESEVEHLEPTSYAPDGVKIRNPQKAIPRLNAYKKGWIQVQDEAAQLVSLLLDPQPGESILDACSGMGGKTAHLAQLMRNRGMITAVDNRPKKLQQLDTEMQRLGISIVNVACQDLQLPREENQQANFDRILLDAPCSGLGVLRRNPDIKWNSSPERLDRLARVQKQILENLSVRLKPGGILVYTVCSLEPEENEAVIEDFLNKNADFVIDNRPGKFPAVLRPLAQLRAGWTTLDYINQMDGFFLARLKKLK